MCVSRFATTPAAAALGKTSASGSSRRTNNVSRGAVIDCFWNGAGVNVLGGNNCGTQFPAGAFD